MLQQKEQILVRATLCIGDQAMSGTLLSGGMLDLSKLGLESANAW
jgi:hypothetical protein